MSPEPAVNFKVSIFSQNFGGGGGDYICRISRSRALKLYIIG